VRLRTKTRMPLPLAPLAQAGYQFPWTWASLRADAMEVLSKIPRWPKAAVGKIIELCKLRTLVGMRASASMGVFAAWDEPGGAERRLQECPTHFFLGRFGRCG
jgi:hypothetical protein